MKPSGLETWILFAIENPTNAMKQMTIKRLMSVRENISVVLSDGMWLGRNVMLRIFISIEIHKKTRTFWCRSAGFDLGSIKVV